MSHPATRERDFPALLMTLLVIGASLCVAGCVRTIEETVLPSPSYLMDDVSYFAPAVDVLWDEENSRWMPVEVAQQEPQ